MRRNNERYVCMHGMSVFFGSFGGMRFVVDRSCVQTGGMRVVLLTCAHENRFLPRIVPTYLTSLVSARTNIDC